MEQVREGWRAYIKVVARPKNRVGVGLRFKRAAGEQTMLSQVNTHVNDLGNVNDVRGNVRRIFFPSFSFSTRCVFHKKANHFLSFVFLSFTFTFRSGVAQCSSKSSHRNTRNNAPEFPSRLGILSGLFGRVVPPTYGRSVQRVWRACDSHLQFFPRNMNAVRR